MSRNSFSVTPLLCIVISAFLSSCGALGLNMNATTPKKAGVYPHFTQKDSLRGTLSRYRSCFDVHYYNLAIDLDLEKKYLIGKIDIMFTATAAMDTFQIDLFDNMKINSIQSNGGELKYWRKYNAVFVVLNTPLPAGSRASITVSYEGQPTIAVKPPWDGGFVWKEDKNKKPWVGITCEQIGASLWYPVKDHLSDEADSTRLSVTISTGLFCASNGVLESRTVNAGKETFVWKTHYTINNYNLTLYIGDFRYFTIPYKNDSLRFYVFSEDLAKAEAAFQQCKTVIADYEALYDEYPFPRDGYKLIESPYEGMEHQTAIAYGNGFKTTYLGLPFDYIIVHESAHEWWGNSITVADVADIWMHEGMATYSEALFVEKEYGHAAYLQYITVYSWLIKNKKPVVGPYGVNYWDYKDGDPYMKGALMMHTFRNLLDDDTLFLSILKSFYQQHKYSIVGTQDFLDWVTQKTGQDYSWFFHQYLFDRACPQLEYNVIDNGVSGGTELVYRWTNVKDDFKLPVMLKNANRTVMIIPSTQLQRTTLQVGSVSFNADRSYISIKENRKLGK